LEKISIQKIKWLRGLGLKKNRDESDCFIVEGEKIISEILEINPNRILFILATSELILKYKLENIENVFVGNENDLSKVSTLNTPPKILAVVSKDTSKEINVAEKIIILDGIQDPGNLGTIIRTADWFGLTQIVCSKNTVDCYNQKVIQASMGSIFRMNIIYTELSDFISNLNVPIHGALLDGQRLTEVNPKNIKVLVLGNEGQGISSGIIEKITNPITIQGFGGAESLNVGIATGIFLYHWVR
jgi:TrmH family RNA methyltransferase